MQIIDNINKTVKEDLQAGIHKGSKMSVAAACFSIYAYQELKNQLEGVDELRFIFTSPTSVIIIKSINTDKCVPTPPSHPAAFSADILFLIFRNVTPS